MTLRLPPEIEDQLKQVAEVEHPSFSERTVVLVPDNAVPAVRIGTQLFSPSLKFFLRNERSCSPPVRLVRHAQWRELWRQADVSATRLP
jgi:hypothetical protein